ncbi:hypothetical protein SAMN05428947_1246 [Mucilaginibacter sp. OK283]|nr:hypothetical protein SAMN05428947_1246 [Mucilaginibacter sp. OK283]
MFVIVVAVKATGLIGLAGKNRGEFSGSFLYKCFWDEKIKADLNIRRSRFSSV